MRICAKLIVAGLVFMTAAASVQAGMQMATDRSPLLPDQPIARASASQAQPSAALALQTSAGDFILPQEIRLFGRTVPSAPASPADASTPGPVGQLNAVPPAPSSLRLALVALASLGAYQAGRSLRRLSFADLPDWYHDHARQVGHVTPLALDFNSHDLPVCRFDEPAEGPLLQPIYQFIPRVLGDPADAHLIRALPRGPPPLPF